MEGKKPPKESATIVLMDEAKLLDVIGRVLDERLDKIVPRPDPDKDTTLLEEYIPKTAIRGKILSASTLWKHEKMGNLKTYAIGGKRYYKRSEIESLIQEVKQ